MKKLFVLFCPKNTAPPRLYKTEVTVKKHVNANPALMYKQIREEQYNQMLLQFNSMPARNMVHSSAAASVAIQTPYQQKSQQIKNWIEAPQVAGNIAFQPQQQQKSQQSKNWIDAPQIKPVKPVKPQQTKTAQPTQGQMLYFQESMLKREFDREEFVQLYADGCSKNNPGRSGVGYLALQGQLTLFEQSSHIGRRTNNQAEFLAMLYGLNDCFLKRAAKVKAFADSLLVVNVCNKKYELREPRLYSIYSEIMKLQGKFKSLQFRHIRRELNTRADKLANRGQLKGHLFGEVDE